MKWYVFVILCVTVLSLAGFAIILIKQDPFQASKLIKSMFIGSFFVASWGLGTLILMAFKNEFPEAFRRGFLAAIVFSGAIILNRLRLLNIFNFFLLLGVAAIMELILTKVINRKSEESWIP